MSTDTVIPESQYRGAGWYVRILGTDTLVAGPLSEQEATAACEWHTYTGYEPSYGAVYVDSRSADHFRILPAPDPESLLSRIEAVTEDGKPFLVDSDGRVMSVAHQPTDTYGDWTPVPWLRSGSEGGGPVMHESEHLSEWAAERMSRAVPLHYTMLWRHGGWLLLCPLAEVKWHDGTLS
jgi:hypothetical protein